MPESGSPATTRPAQRRRTMTEVMPSEAWNQTDRDYPDALLHEAFAAQVARDPSAPAVRFRDERSPTWQLDQRVGELAAYLVAMGVDARLARGRLHGALGRDGRGAARHPARGRRLRAARPRVPGRAHRVHARRPRRRRSCSRSSGWPVASPARGRSVVPTDAASARAVAGSMAAEPTPRRAGRPRLRDLHVGLHGPAQGRDDHAPRHRQPPLLDAGALRADAGGQGPPEDAVQLRRLGVGALLAADVRRRARRRRARWSSRQRVPRQTISRPRHHDDPLRALDAPALPGGPAGWRLREPPARLLRRRGPAAGPAGPLLRDGSMPSCTTSTARPRPVDVSVWACDRDSDLPVRAHRQARRQHAAAHPRRRHATRPGRGASASCTSAASRWAAATSSARS